MKKFAKMYTLQQSLKIYIMKRQPHETNFYNISYNFVKYTTAFSIIYYKRNTKIQGDRVLLTISKTNKLSKKILSKTRSYT